MGKNIDKFVGYSKESSNSTVDNTKSEDNLTEEQLTILLCKELEKGSQEYDVNESIRALANLKEQRIIYSVISDEMYSMSNKDDQSAEIGNFISNIEKLNKTSFDNKPGPFINEDIEKGIFIKNKIIATNRLSIPKAINLGRKPA